MSKRRTMCDFLSMVVISGVLYSGCLTPAEAQNVTCPTRPAGDSTNACASTAFVQTAVGSGQVPINVESLPAPILPSNSAATNSANLATALATPKVSLIFPHDGYAFSTSATLTASQTITCAYRADPTVSANFIQTSTGSDLFIIHGSQASIHGCSWSIAGVPTGTATGLKIGNDAVRVTTGNVITSGNPVITCTSCTFTSADIGKTLTCLSCMAGPANQANATITGFTDANHVTISPTPTASITNTTIGYGFNYQMNSIKDNMIYNWQTSIHIYAAVNFDINSNILEASDALIIENQIWADQGDGKLTNNWIVANLAGAHTAFQYLSGGGLIAPGNKFLAIVSVTSCINVFWNGNVSSLGPWIDGGSIEGGCTSGILLNTNGTATADGGRLIGTEITIANGGVCVNLQPTNLHSTWTVQGIQCFETGVATGLFITNMKQILLGPNNVKNNDGNGGGLVYNINSASTGSVYLTPTDVGTQLNNLSSNMLLYGNPGIPFASLPAVAANGSQIFVTDGTAGSPCTGAGSGAMAIRQNSAWVCLGAASGTVTSVTGNGLTITTSGTIPEPFDFENCSLSASVGSNLLTVALKDASGADASATSPCRIAFRNVTAATGQPTFISVTAALSINTNAVGATLGSSSNTAFRFWVVAFNNGGTPVLALFNASSAQACNPINEGLVQSSTAISAGAASAGVFYTPNGTTVSSKAIKILGYVEYNSTGLATAGTYATGPNFINIFGPGVKKPCDTVQTISFEDTTITSASANSTTPVQSATAATITPTSAANPIRAQVWGAYGSTQNAQVCFSQISRGTGPTFFGTKATLLNTAGGSVLDSFAGLRGYDRPNTTSATTYVVFISVSGSASSCIWNRFGTGLSSAIELQEIQG